MCKEMIFIMKVNQHLNHSNNMIIHKVKEIWRGSKKLLLGPSKKESIM